MIDNGNEEAIQSMMVQYINELNSEKNSNETPVEYTVAYEKLFHKVKLADVILVEYCEHKQRKVPR